MLNSTFTTVVFIDELDAIGMRRFDADKSIHHGVNVGRSMGPRITMSAEEDRGVCIGQESM